MVRFERQMQAHVHQANEQIAQTQANYVIRAERALYVAQCVRVRGGRGRMMSKRMCRCVVSC